MNQSDRLLKAIEGYNEIEGYRVANGLVLNFSHSASNDDAVTVFVSEDRIAFWSEKDGTNRIEEEWDLEEKYYMMYGKKVSGKVLFDLGWPEGRMLNNE